MARDLAVPPVVRSRAASRPSRALGLALALASPVALCLAPAVVAAQTRGLAVPVPGAHPEERARAFLVAHGAPLGVDRDLDLVLESVRVVHGFTIVRFRRRALGLEVFGRSVIVRLAPDGRVDLATARPGSILVDPSPATVAPAALPPRASALFPEYTSARGLPPRAIGVDVGGAVRRGFEVEVEGARRHERGLVLFDAAGEVLAAGSRAAHALGRVYDPNPPRARGMTSDLPLENLTPGDRLTGRLVRALACDAAAPACAPVQTAVADAAGDFLFDPIEPSYADPFSEVSAYFHADRAARYFERNHGFVWTCCDALRPLDVVSNYVERAGSPHDNAAYVPSSCSRDECGAILLGQGRLHDFAYDGDVVYHELTHAVVDLLAGIVGFDFDRLGISYEPSAINEGMADYFAATITGDSSVAEYFTGAGGLGGPGALRELDNALSCPRSLFGEGHFDGRVWAGALWEIRGLLGAEATDALVFVALATMPDNVSLAEAAELLVGTGQTMLGSGALSASSLAALERALDARGLSGCERVVPLDDGEQRTGYSGQQFATGSLGGSVAPIHYSVEIPADATRLVLRLARLGLAGEYTYYFRDGRPSSVQLGRMPPLLFDGSAPAAPRVELTAAGPHPLPRCATLHIALRVEDLQRSGESVYQISAELERSGDPSARCPEPPAADAGEVAALDAGPPPGRTPHGGGCRACGVGPAAPPPSAPLCLIFAALVLRLSRRRRGPPARRGRAGPLRRARVGARETPWSR